MTYGMLLYFLYFSGIWHIYMRIPWNNIWYVVTFQEFAIYMRIPWSMTYGMLLHFLHVLFRNLTFAWKFLGRWHMACHYISYNLKFAWVNDTKHAITFTVLFRNSHEIFLVKHVAAFLYSWEIWRLHEISLQLPYISYSAQNFEIYMRFTVVFLNKTSKSAWYVKSVIHLVNPDLWKGIKNELWQYIIWIGKMRPKKVTASWEYLLISLTILHKSPCVAHCTVTALLEWLFH